MKKNTGITLVSLVITIIVMLILAATAVYTGIESYQNAQLHAFVSKMQLIQEKVNILYQNNQYSEFLEQGELQIPEQEKEKAKNAYKGAKEEEGSNIQGEFEDKQFCYLTPSLLKKYFDLDNMDIRVIICFSTREVICIDGIEYRGTKYYTQYNLPGGRKNLQHDASNIETMGFVLEKLNFGLTAKIKVSNIQPNNAKVYYREVGTYWQEVNNNEVDINKTGNYEFRIVGQEETEYKRTINVTLVNSPKLSEGMIPIRWDEAEGAWIVTSKEEGIWYDYEEQQGTTESGGTAKWANVMLSDGKYTSDTVEVRTKNRRI